METIINEIVFEKSDKSPKTETILPKELSYEPMVQFVQSGYFINNTLQMDRFLDSDKTIDLEKLELAIILLIEYLEFFSKSDEPIYIFLGGMDIYFDTRGIGIKNIERVTEESSFILGFCNSIAQENALEHAVVVQYKLGVNHVTQFS